MATGGEYVSEYLGAETAGAPRSAYPAYDGYMLETATGPVIDADLLAPTLLNVRHLSVKTYYLLQQELTYWQPLLDQLDPALSLVDATADDLRLVGALFAGIDEDRLDGAKATTLSKILHRKRPALIPLQDKQVRRCYQQGSEPRIPVVPGRGWADFTVALAEEMQHDLRSQLDAFEQLSRLADGVPVTPLRALDIVAWFLGKPATAGGPTRSARRTR